MIWISLAIVVIIITYLISNSTDLEKQVKEIISNTTKITINQKSSLNISVANSDFYRKVINKGELGLAESFMDGDWTTDNLYGVLLELQKNRDKISKHIKSNMFQILLFKIYYCIFRTNTRDTVKNNVSHHYDIGNDLYRKQLGRTMQYTCAYYHKSKMTLNQAQDAKMKLIAKKLDLQPGMSVLDIGCGFGALAYYLVKRYSVKVLGVTLSEEQIKYANKYYKHPNLTIKYKDYRDVTGKFDRVYSIGMFEQVGKDNYSVYFDKCYELLKTNGIMLLHTISKNYRENPRYNFITQYIFPEGELPHISDLSGKFLDNKWHLEDLHNFGQSYNKTLLDWHKNLDNFKELPNYSPRFQRMWKYYLLGCSAAFKVRMISLWQIVYTKIDSNRPDDLHHIRDCR